MPCKFEIPFDPSWPLRREAWEAHYRAKGASEMKARRLAATKRYKLSWPKR